MDACEVEVEGLETLLRVAKEKPDAALHKQ
jgi:hypothetical protein